MSGYAGIVSLLIKTGMENSPLFPYDKSDKHRAERPHSLDVALKQNKIIVISPNIEYFEIGNEEAESKAPQYHINEDSKIIRMPNRGTNKSRGSQRLVQDKAKRDYGNYVWLKGTQKGKSETSYLTQEYRQSKTRNYAGLAEKSREYEKRLKTHNVYKRNYRYNKHYMYMERILDSILPNVAMAINAKVGMGHESLMEENSDVVLDRSDYITVAENADSRDNMEDEV